MPDVLELQERSHMPQEFEVGALDGNAESPHIKLFLPDTTPESQVKMVLNDIVNTLHSVLNTEDEMPINIYDVNNQRIYSASEIILSGLQAIANAPQAEAKPAGPTQKATTDQHQPKSRETDPKINYTWMATDRWGG